jgi:hypothetical protein
MVVLVFMDSLTGLMMMELLTKNLCNIGKILVGLVGVQSPCSAKPRFLYTFSGYPKVHREHTMNAS